MESNSDPVEKAFCSSQPPCKSKPQSLTNDNNDTLSTDNNPLKADRAVVDDCNNNNKASLPETRAKIFSLECEAISITSADVIPKVESDDNYIAVVAAFPPGIYKAKKPIDINIPAFVKEERVDPCYNKYLFSMNLDSHVIGSSQHESPPPLCDITPDKFQGMAVHGNLILMPPPSFAMSPVVKAPSPAWVHTLDALPDTTYAGLMDIPTGNPKSLPKGLPCNDTVEKGHPLNPHAVTVWYIPNLAVHQQV